LDEISKSGPPDKISGSMRLAAQRTVLAYERTGLGADRTLMAVVRTALALIGFGFTIFQFFHKLSDKFLASGLPAEAPRRFGAALIVLGVLLLVLGIADHAHASRERGRSRQWLEDEKLLDRSELSRRVNGSQAIAGLLLLIGVLAILRVGLSAGPF
jgi:putative membrane protein